MGKFKLTVPALAMLIAASAAEADSVRGAIEEALVKFEAAFNKGNAATVASLYTEDAALLPPGEQRVDGRKAIEAYWQGAIDAGLKNLALKAVEVESDGDLAYEVGAAAFDVPGEDERMTTLNAKYVVVWKRSGGQWRLHRDIWNMEPAPSGQ